MINRSRMLQLMGLMLFAITLFWLSEMLTIPKPAVVDDTSTPTHDYIIGNMESHILDKNGKPKFVLSATHLTHYPKQKHSQLQRPVLLQFNANGSTTRTTAMRGLLPDDGKRIIMTGDVRIKRPGSNRQSLVQAKTERLEIILRKGKP